MCTLFGLGTAATIAILVIGSGVIGVSLVPAWKAGLKAIKAKFGK